MLTLIYFILILGIIVLVHEFGHFIFSKMFGVHVYEFSIGMGPRIWGTKKEKGKTQYNIRAFPIGGFVSLAGEDPEEVDPEVPEGGYLYNKPIWQRFIIMAAGVFNNFVLALVILFLIGIFHGSVNMTPVITSLDKDYPMYQTGIREGDIIKSINGNKVDTLDDANVYLTLENDGSETEFVIERNDEEYIFLVQPVEEEDEETHELKFRYGITFEKKTEHGFVNAIKYAFTQFMSYIKQIIITFKYLFTGRLGINNLSGPVGIYSVVGEVTKESVFLNLASLTALLSVNVGFLNIMPFPAFDGGRILFLLIEKLRGRPVNPKIENMVNTIGFALLMLLVIYVTIGDVGRLFG